MGTFVGLIRRVPEGPGVHLVVVCMGLHGLHEFAVFSRGQKSKQIFTLSGRAFEWYFLITQNSLSKSLFKPTNFTLNLQRNGHRFKFWRIFYSCHFAVTDASFQKHLLKSDTISKLCQIPLKSEHRWFNAKSLLKCAKMAKELKNHKCPDAIITKTAVSWPPRRYYLF